MSHPSSLDAVFARLRKAGFDTAHVRRTLLPPWWNDEVGMTDAGVYSAMNHVASRLGVSLAGLRGLEPLVLTPNCNVRHKLAKGTSPDDIRLSELLALRVAQEAATAVRVGVQSIPSAAVIRESILLAGAPWVGFEHLLDWCWDNGILVLHISDFPKGARKPHGLVAVLSGRPVIVLCWNQHSPAWLLFHLAHELGHVSLGHVSDGTMLVDEQIDAESREADEAAANAYALTIITGRGDRELTSQGKWPVTSQMVAAAREYGAKHRIDPGHVALNYSRTMATRTNVAFFRLAGAVLRELEKGTDAIQLVRDRLVQRLDWGVLHDDAREFVEQMTGTSS